MTQNRKLGRLRPWALVTAALTVLPLAFAGAALAEGATNCTGVDYTLGSRLGAGLLTPGKGIAVQKLVAYQSGLMILLHTSGEATWELKDEATGDVWLSGATSTDAPAAVFTQPSPFTTLCLEVTNTGALPLTFVYAFERVS